MIQVPEGSLYFWCYTQGLKHTPLNKIDEAVRATGRFLRKKDVDNYWNGWYRSDLYLREGDPDSIWSLSCREVSRKPELMTLDKYPVIPAQYAGTLLEQRWVPCNANNKPMIKWGQGCMSRIDAESYIGQKYLAENNKGCSRIIIDCDGDHDAKLDLETVLFLSQFILMTHTLYKTKRVVDYEGYSGCGIELPASYHLSFETDVVMPTMHFPKAGIDIIGNKENTLRYMKTKKWNGVSMAKLTPEIWDSICTYIKNREGR